MRLEGTTGSVIEPTSNVLVRDGEREEVQCSATAPTQCPQEATMKWYGQPFCTAHAPHRPHRKSEWAWRKL